MAWTGDRTTDLRARLRVPDSYLTGLAGGPATGTSAGAGNMTPPQALKQVQGIVFPYTPTISFNNQAQYSALAPTHSNFNSYFYKNSQVGPISVAGKFTCQNEYEAAIMLSVQHLLRALTKMHTGNDNVENFIPGSPPAVCRFDAYGNSMLSNVPVSVQSWKMEYPEGVDYIQVGDGIKDYGNNLVPTMATISLELVVTYSRSEMLDYSVEKFINGALPNKGYL
jgi:hypothetical protein